MHITIFIIYQPLIKIDFIYSETIIQLTGHYKNIIDLTSEKTISKISPIRSEQVIKEYG